MLSIVIWLKNISKPNEAKISASTEVAVVEEEKLSDFNSKYFRTKYPDRYELKDNTKPSASLQSWQLLAHQSIGGRPAAQFSVVVENMPSGGVKESSAYKLFSAYPNLYSLVQKIYQNESVTVALRSDPSYTQTVLWPHGRFLLTISQTSSTRSDRLEKEFETLLSNLSWN